MQEILRDRATEPDTLCRHMEDDLSTDFFTFASVIAEPAKGQMWVAVGPPGQHPYQRSTFGETAPLPYDRRQQMAPGAVS
jgi:isopenicillin-N N-acyltransferase-like protein